jgi:hypothetical protein
MSLVRVEVYYSCTLIHLPSYNQITAIDTIVKLIIYKEFIRDKQKKYRIKCLCPFTSSYCHNLTSLWVIIPISIECVTHKVVVVESTSSRLTAQPYIER